MGVASTRDVISTAACPEIAAVEACIACHRIASPNQYAVNASAWKSAARGVCVTVWRRCRALMSTSGTATPNQANVKNTLGITVIAALALVLFRLQDLKT